MSTSQTEQMIYAPESLYDGSEAPICASLTQRVVANNLMHGCDSMAQPRINFWPAKAFGGNNREYVEVDSVDEVDAWYLLGGFPMGPWPLTMAPDGRPYRLNVTMAGAVSAVAGNARFRLIIAPSYASARLGLTEDTDRVWQTTNVVNSTTPSVLTGLSRGDGASSTYIDVPRSMAQEWIRDLPAFDAVSGGSPVNVRACLVSAWVFAYTSNVTSQPRLYGLRVAEYLQP